MDLERLVDLVEPLGTVGRPAPTALIERQLQLTQQARDLLARRDMSHALTGPERRFVEFVERGEPTRKELAVNHPLREERKPSRNDRSLRLLVRSAGPPVGAVRRLSRTISAQWLSPVTE